MAGQTLIQKIFAAHTTPGASVDPDDIIWLDLDVRTARDFGGANVVKNYREHYGDTPVADAARTFFTFDLVVPPSNIPYANNRNFPGKQGAGETYLASPVTAAWCARKGEIASPG